MANCSVRHIPKLKYLARQLLGVQIQQGEHDSASDARVALRIYLLHQKKWERDFQRMVSQYGGGGLYGAMAAGWNT